MTNTLPPASAERRLLHTRTVTCRGYQRADGLWDIEGHMTDIKTYAIDNDDRNGQIPAGEPIHEMWLRLTLDLDLNILDAAASTEYAPFNHCHSISRAYQALIGLQIGPGWNRAVKDRLGGVKGCTHLTELLGPMATSAYQTMYEALRDHHQRQGHTPFILDTCHSLSRTSPVVARVWPEHYQAPESLPTED